MFIFNNSKKRIQAYLDGVGNEKSAFDLILTDYLNGELKRKLESLLIKGISIHVDWSEDVKCIGVQGRYQAYYIDLQIYPDEYTLSYDTDEADDGETYPLKSREQVYDRLLGIIKRIHSR